MVAPSTWKGNLRFAAGKVDENNKEKIINRLFGPESDSGEEAKKGRLYFFPTFFTGKVEKDVITPLSRDTRTPVKGRGPIDMEVVPAGETGDFYLLYFPYPKGKDWKPEEVLEDLEFTIEALEKMFLEYGFSAKKTSGFGVIHEKFEDFSLWWDERNKEKNRDFRNIKDFQTLKDEIKKMSGGVK
jgi:CRISPR-associated protein Cmr2